MVHDQNLIGVLTHHIDETRRCFVMEDWERLRAVSDFVLPHLGGHPLFQEGISHFFRSKQLMLTDYAQIQNLLRVAAIRDPEQAVAWLNKIAVVKEADLRYVAEVRGLKTSVRVTLEGGVNLAPLNQCPSSPNATLLKQKHQFHGPNNMEPLSEVPICAYMEVKGVIGSKSAKALASPRCAELERAIAAFTLVGKAAPVIGNSWVEFVDEDLALAEFGQVWMSPNFEGLPPRAPAIEIDNDAVCWAERYLNLSDDVRGPCEVAIERLNLARRRRSPGDQALEGAICLEALLLDDHDQELTYRLRLRAALLVATTLKERLSISKGLTAFYALRSKTVHGSGTTDSSKDQAVAALGLDICAQVLRGMVSLGKKFAGNEWELCGGNPEVFEEKLKGSQAG